MKNQNHPQRGSCIKVEPIRSLIAIQTIKERLACSPRDLALFLLGINTNLRASDLLALTVGAVRHLQPGDSFELREKKTGKVRRITLNGSVHKAIQAYLATRPACPEAEPLFASRKTGKGLQVPSLTALVKRWCAEAGLRGNYGSHSLRKTFGYVHRTVHGTDIITLMVLFNHRSQAQTLAYLGIQPEELRQAYLHEI